MLSNILAYLKFYFGAITIYNVHSPFVYDFMFDVMDNSKQFYVYNHLEHERKMLLSNQNEINFIDHGAGSRLNNKNKRKISTIAKSSLSHKNQCRLLFNLVNKYQPKNIIELGTSLGISTLYMAAACKKSEIHTIEGNPESAKLAATLFERNNAKNIHIYKGTFEQHLPTIIENCQQIGLAYVDGNHTYEATMKYFNQMLPKCDQNSILVFDDIYWSDGMNKAWKEMIQNKKISISIDLFDIGILFFNNGVEKQDFKLIEYLKKPWKIGLFG